MLFQKDLSVLLDQKLSMQHLKVQWVLLDLILSMQYLKVQWVLLDLLVQKL
jgi:hypothetical protein